MKKESNVMEADWNWIEAFEAEKKRILMILGSHAVAIGHTGGKERTGQETKSILDMFIGVAPFRGRSFYQSMFGLKDYRYTPTDMTERYVFKKYENGIWRYNLHILPFNDAFYEQDIFLLRDYLQEYPELLLEYSGAKKQSAKNHSRSLDKILTSFWNNDRMLFTDELNPS